MKVALLLGTLAVAMPAMAQLPTPPAYGQSSPAYGAPGENASNNGMSTGRDFHPTKQERATLLKREAAKQQLLARRAAKAKAKADAG